eukprot:1350709-Alexandrium_andersonii.AAC.1
MRLAIHRGSASLLNGVCGSGCRLPISAHGGSGTHSSSDARLHCPPSMATWSSATRRRFSSP